ncbi:MAG TPA: hypothetical protein VHN80_25590 [Kineosporiaceae bacterium]|jgi:hypothetical protein|nr:hypothetical protein [Kineosporiaceae bacterium]
MTEDAISRPLDLSAVRARRASLRKAGLRVERVLSMPVQGRQTTWVGELAPVVAELIRAWETHVALTEGPDGLLEQITVDAPRLAGMVGRLRREHLEVAERLRTAGERLLSAEESGPGQAREDLTAVLVRIGRHRADGGELIHQAYRIDIGGE